MELNTKWILQIADETHFIRDNLEKVFRLANLLEAIFSSPAANSLALKGGTAINVFYADMPRLSVDIDLDYLGEGMETMRADRENIKSIILGLTAPMGYRLSERSKNTYALDSFVLSYRNLVGNNDVIKVEINYLDRKHILPIAQSKINVLRFQGAVMVNVLSKEELYGSKLSALVSRGKTRDLFDVAHAISHGIIANTDLLRKCALFYDCIGGKAAMIDGGPFDYESLSWEDVRSTLTPTLPKGAYFDHVKAIEEVTAFLNDLFVFEESEIAFAQKFASKVYEPELLFGPSKEAEEVKDHPMALWRTRQND